MKNGSIFDQLNILERQIASTKIQPANQLNVGTVIPPDIPTLQQSKNNESIINMSDLGFFSALGLLTPEPNNTEEQQIPVKRKKKKPKRGSRQ